MKRLAFLILCLAGCSTLPLVKSPATSDRFAVHVIDQADGTPLADVVVTAGQYNHLPQAVAGKTDASGNFSGKIPKLAADFTRGDISVRFEDYVVSELWLHRDGYVPQRIDAFQCAPGRNAKNQRLVTVALTASQPVRGRVLRADGRPVVGEPVLLAGTVDHWPVQYQTSTDASGGFYWNDAPRGELFLILGLNDRNPEPVFERFASSAKEIVVKVGPDWQATPAGEKPTLVAVAVEGDRPVLPMAQPFGNWAVFPGWEEPLKSMIRPIRCLVLSTTDRGNSIDYFCLSGERGQNRMSGRMSGSLTVRKYERSKKAHKKTAAEGRGVPDA